MKSRNPKAEESEQACLARTKAGADAEAAYEERRRSMHRSSRIHATRQRWLATYQSNFRRFGLQ